MSTDTIHIVYVHGFRGDHTSFQAFPSDLHRHLLPKLPTLQTWIYPTYKSSKPLTFAKDNLLRWLSGIPDGRVILAGHSMGGLLIAEAALDPSPVARRIIGLLAFDTPYLGMHPHVVVSGIASLLPKKEMPGSPSVTAQGMPTESEVNTSAVNIVKAHDAFPLGDRSRSTTPVSLLELNPQGGSGPATSSTSLPTYRTAESVAPSYQSTRPSTSILSPTPHPSASPSIVSSVSLMEKTRSFIAKHSTDPFVIFLQKHSDAPAGAISRWVVENFEFGFAMFDYTDLWERYNKLEQWNGAWVNFWTETGAHGETNEESGGRPDDKWTERWSTSGGHALVVGRRERAISPSVVIEDEFERAMKKATEKERKKREKEESVRRKKEEKIRLKTEKEERERLQREREEAIKEGREVPPEVTTKPKESPPPSPQTSNNNCGVGPHHFITLPWSSKERWIKVKITGVEDEVAAHCGLFIQSQNLEYDDFVARVGRVVLGWLQ